MPFLPTVVNNGPSASTALRTALAILAKRLATEVAEDGGLSPAMR
ncbi:hypothetical protein [Agrobacterium rosae]|uniref:Uncharacterized protein n=1 Tax=Agrobacterium rosae TaxID=1972867 RepID=A0AAW9FLV0_9HYPH|nr:hypothetical protein [Agrobacterium rosae]MDX8304552.1 hypothetical protein [Agrobacterium rosae]